MTAITASLVKELRERSGAGMMDCKKALAEKDADIEAAMDWLRSKGLSAAKKKAGRVAAEGLVAVVTGGEAAIALEVNSETDFVSRNEQFQKFVSTLASVVFEQSPADVDALSGLGYPGTDRTVAEELTYNIATIGENQSIRRFDRLAVEHGVVASYIHNAVGDGLGRIAVLVALESAADVGKLNELGRSIAMHIAAARPDALRIEDVDPAALEREKAVLTEQAAGSGKPANIVEKMVEGRLRKYYEEVVLLEQVFVVDGESKVKAVVEKVAKEVGTPITVAGFLRYSLGEGIDKEESDFAAEVAATVGKD
jgi:elongation factor Ts